MAPPIEKRRSNILLMGIRLAKLWYALMHLPTTGMEDLSSAPMSCRADAAADKGYELSCNCNAEFRDIFVRLHSR